MPSSGYTTFPMLTTIDNVNDTVTGAAEAISGGHVAPNGTGVIWTITFNATAKGTSNINFTRVTLLNPALNKTPVARINGTATVDGITLPIITFVPPPPTNNSEVNVDYVFVNVTLGENGNTAILNWNGTNETMLGAGMNFYLNKTGLSNGTYVYKVYANDTADNWNVSRQES